MVDETIELLTKGVGKKIAWLLFLESHNEPSILSILKPKKYKRHKESYQKFKREHASEKTKSLRAIHRVAGNTNKINDCFKLWTTLNFFDLKTTQPPRKGKNGKEHHSPLKKYQFNMNPFFDSHKKIKFTAKQKKILDFLFFPWWIRYSVRNEFKKDDIIKAISKFYIKYYFHTPAKDRKNPKSDFNFSKDYFRFDNSPYRNEWVSKPKVKLVKIPCSKRKPSKSLKLAYANLEEYNKYLNGPALFKDKRKLKTIKINPYFFTSLYLCVYKYYKEEMDELDSFMVKTLDLNKL